MKQNIRTKTCRVCGNRFYEEPVLTFDNMPKAAQYLPDVESLNEDWGVHIGIFQCSCCGLVQLDSAPVPYYKEVIRASAFSAEMQEFRRIQFTEFVQKYHLKYKKIIEIGCGHGEYLTIMQQCGVSAYGLEYGDDSVKYCIRNGLKVSKGFVHNSHQNLRNAKFDAFFIMNFLEHLPDPNSFLKGIAYNLVDGGIGLVEVPNFDMIIRNQLFSEFIPDHLFYFTKDTLCTTLHQNGFDILNCEEIWHDYIISAIVKKRDKLNLDQFAETQTNLKNKLDVYIGRFPDKKVAIWGAGHQALSIISQLQLSGKIQYVIDSAIFKQGKFTPVTHIPIVSPDTLNSNPVDAVIVMTAGYSDEVVSIIHKQYNKHKLSIATLKGSILEIC